MKSQNPKNFEDNLRTQITILKQRLENIGSTINVQEQILDILTENTKSLLKEAVPVSKSGDSVEEIIKRAFTGGKLPKSLSK